MKHLVAAAGIAAAAAGAAAGAAQAGGIDRARLSYGLLFETGSYVELGFSHVSPDVSGTYLAGLGGGSTGDMAGTYTSWSFGYRQDLSDQLSVALLVNTPYGADAYYPSGAYTGLQATWKSTQVAGLLRYEVSPQFSVYGGLRYVRSSADITIPLVPGGYAATAAADGRFGYLIGAAYEKPEIALRVGLTYESSITHKFASVETGPAVPGSPRSGTTEIKMPQSITLDFQSGVAKDTLVFGSIRWSEWTVWEVRPPGYNLLSGGSNITDFDNDVITWQLGVGRRLNENWSVFVRATYEDSKGGVASRLAPTDGMKSIGIGGTYTNGPVKVTAGLEYVDVGDAVDASGTRFAGNKAVGFGMSVGYRF